ncbi:MAG: hypothetical protein MJZ81_10870 [Bacteroidales bacterium]|nr:hypothetical protein [Bacteroidales bacterium]
MTRSILFNLKREWYDRIASGKKSVEYRRVCKHWSERLGVRWPISSNCMERLRNGIVVNADWTAVFRLGYSRKYPDVIRNIERIDVGPCPYPGWDGEYFRIYFSSERTEDR